MAGSYHISGPPKRVPPLVLVPVGTDIIDGKPVTILKLERAADYDKPQDRPKRRKFSM